jgi:hypothetical protein
MSVLKDASWHEDHGEGLIDGKIFDHAHPAHQNYVWCGMNIDDRNQIIEAQRQPDGGHQHYNVSPSL